ncbi:MAG TPA: hypothetical protein VIQ51_18300 [Chryseosolibacter sp.]|jgi:hypothetical protein
MEAFVFVRQPNSTEYSDLGAMKFSVLPRVDEFFSVKSDGAKKYFQVFAIHHVAEEDGAIELYAMEVEPSWKVKSPRSIGFGH